MKGVWILVLIFGLNIIANAQRATISGQITDDYGAILPNAKVEFKDKDGKIISTKTGNKGIYRIELTSGNYTIEISFPPFQKLSISDYWVVRYSKMNLDVALQCKGECKRIEHSHSSKQERIVETTKSKSTNESMLGSLEVLPGPNNKNKRKTKNNK
jgi:hypothetical protein